MSIQTDKMREWIEAEHPKRHSDPVERHTFRGALLSLCDELDEARAEVTALEGDVIKLGRRAEDAERERDQARADVGTCCNCFARMQAVPTSYEFAVVPANLTRSEFESSELAARCTRVECAYCGTKFFVGMLSDLLEERAGSIE